MEKVFREEEVGKGVEELNGILTESVKGGGEKEGGFEEEEEEGEYMS